jgi:hypothetical protein
MVIDLRHYLPTLADGGTRDPAPDPAAGLRQAKAQAEAATRLSKGVGLLESGLAGGAGGLAAFAKARQALGTEGAFGPVLDELQAVAQAQEETRLLREARNSAFAALKQVAQLPLPLPEKAALGRSVVARALAGGAIAAEEQPAVAASLLSESLLQQTRQALAATAEPGAAKALVEEAKQQGLLVPHDEALLDRLVAERAPVEALRHRARLSWKEQDDLAAYARGELPEPLGEESFPLFHGARAALGAYARYQEARRVAPAVAAIRGKSAEEIAAARLAWAGDPADFQRAFEQDAEARRRDPAGYLLATATGLQQALDEIESPAERQALLWVAQGSLGLAERERSPWSLAEEERLADAWDAIPPGHGGRNEKLGFFEKHLLGLPAEQRPAAIARLVRQGIVDGTEAELGQLVADVEAGRVNPARRIVGKLTPAEQYADSGYIASDTGKELPSVGDPPAGKVAAPVPAPRDWRSAGIPDSQSDTDWRTSVYRSGRQDALASTLAEVLTLESEPGKLAEVEASIEQALAGDEWAIDFFIRHARTLAKAQDDDAATGDDRRTWSREAVEEARDRVLAGEPYNESWAELRPTLAQIEQETGLRLRPTGSSGLVAIYQAERDVPIFSLPLPVLKDLSDAPEALSEFVGLAGKLLHGDNISEEVENLRIKLVETTDYLGEDGEPRSDTDASRFEDTQAAIKDARDRLAEGASPDEVFLHLAQVVLAEELDDTDLALEAVKALIQFVPYYDLVELGISAAELVQALDAGDWAGAAQAGLVGALAAVGTVPIVGDLAKGGLSWFARKTGLLELAAYRRSKAWLKLSRTVPALEMAGIVGRDVRRYLDENVGRGGDLSTDDYLEKLVKRAGLEGADQAQAKGIFTTKIFARAAEIEIERRFRRLVAGTGFRLVPNTRMVSSGISPGKSKPDFLMYPNEISEESIDQIYKEAAEAIQDTPFLVVEAKSSKAKASRGQSQLRKDLSEAGAPDAMLVRNVPHKRISASSFTKSASEFFAKEGRKLSTHELMIVERLAEKVKRSLPGGTPVLQVYGTLLLATAIAFGVSFGFSHNEHED